MRNPMKSILVLTILLLQIAISAFGQKSDTFDVYFERNDAKLNPKGSEFINKLIADGSLVRGQKLILLGYADYLGTNGHNDSLSVSRAKNVEDLLIRKGINKKDITLCVGKGKIDRMPVGKNGYGSDRKVQIIAMKHKKEVAAPPEANKVSTNADQPSLNIEMVKVTGRNFHFAIGKYDITEAQWRAVMGQNSSSVNKCDSCPVTYVSWNDVQDFLQKLNGMTGKHYRLPSEAEWEFAAKGGSKSHNYVYAGSNDINQVAWYVDNSNGRTHPVGQKQPNELGIYDMSGNVWQWCSPRIDTSISNRALRGGAWFIKSLYSRVAYHMRDSPTDRNDADGFRVAYSL